MWNLRYDTNEHIHKTETESHGEQTSDCQGAGGRAGKKWEFGVSRGKLLYTEWINNKVLLYSTGKYIQYPVTNHNGKEYEKEYIYIHTLLCCAEEINTTL